MLGAVGEDIGTSERQACEDQIMWNSVVYLSAAAIFERGSDI
jgi:hypothetical protein